MTEPTSSQDAAPQEGTPTLDEAVVPDEGVLPDEVALPDEGVVVEPKTFGPRPTGGFIRPV